MTALDAICVALAVLVSAGIVAVGVYSEWIIRQSRRRRA